MQMPAPSHSFVTALTAAQRTYSYTTLLTLNRRRYSRVCQKVMQEEKWKNYHNSSWWANEPINPVEFETFRPKRQILQSGGSPESVGKRYRSPLSRWDINFIPYIHFSTSLISGLWNLPGAEIRQRWVFPWVLSPKSARQTRKRRRRRRRNTTQHVFLCLHKFSASTWRRLFFRRTHANKLNALRLQLLWSEEATLPGCRRSITGPDSRTSVIMAGGKKKKKKAPCGFAGWSLCNG